MIAVFFGLSDRSVLSQQVSATRGIIRVISFTVSRYWPLTIIRKIVPISQYHRTPVLLFHVVVHID